LASRRPLPPESGGEGPGRGTDMWLPPAHGGDYDGDNDQLLNVTIDLLE
jgi:hypothetical protein